MQYYYYKFVTIFVPTIPPLLPAQLVDTYVESLRGSPGPLLADAASAWPWGLQGEARWDLDTDEWGDATTTMTVTQYSLFYFGMNWW